ncbi:lactonase family protein [Jeongeupia naejangsanensis]|uniref:Lactonase family protein n=1 Tax=Jeongeupia naejangsanensis TaxID=613195 RepID=A0ABS2BQ21_9NEIS|nr:lactonase family protein [Jeongeupia naejangsanensis]MBM3116884.1 lactonase family protein [Jeongeupia naejangsanensis]
MNGQPRVYIGCYGDAEQATIHAFAFDADHGRLLPLQQLAGVGNASYLLPADDRLYAVSETATGEVVALAVDADGRLSEINRVSSGGDSPCYLAKTGNALLVANYFGHNAALLPLTVEGQVRKIVSEVRHQGASGVDVERQDAPHLHSITPSPDGRFALVCDLGRDEIVVYRIDGQQLLPHGVVSTAPGDGPRHLLFDAAGRFVYVVGELTSTVLVYAWQDGALVHRQTISSLPAGFAGANTGAELQLSPDGAFLYASNRGHDSIATFRVADGLLEVVGQTHCGGQMPRNFALSPCGGWLLVANQASGNLALFARAADGVLTQAPLDVQLDRPVCVKFA